MIPVRHKLAGIQCLRAVAALLVVFYHLQLFEQKLPGEQVMPSQMESGMAGVDLFFVISGFIVTTISLGKFASPGYALRFLRLRFFRIYPTYWVYFLGLLGGVFTWWRRHDAEPHARTARTCCCRSCRCRRAARHCFSSRGALVFELVLLRHVRGCSLRWLHQSQLPPGCAGGLGT